MSRWPLLGILFHRCDALGGSDHNSSPDFGGAFQSGRHPGLALKRDLRPRDAAVCTIAVQVAGGNCGTIWRHAMFALPLWEASLKNSEAGGCEMVRRGRWPRCLVATIPCGIRLERASFPWLSGLYIRRPIGSQSSTSFANPAVAIARSIPIRFRDSSADLLGFNRGPNSAARSSLDAE